MALYCATPHYRLIQPVVPQTRKTPSKPYRTQINIQSLAEMHFDRYDFDLSLAVYHELCRLSPRAAIAHVYFNIGQIHLHLDEKRESASWFLKAVAIDPFFAAAYFQLGVVSIGLGRLRLAVEYFSTCRSVAVRGGSVGHGDVNYDQVGMRYTLRIADVDMNIMACKMAEGNRPELPYVMIPAGTLFRVQDRKRLARAQDPAKTAEWRFRDEARVVAEIPETREEAAQKRRGSQPRKAW